MQLIDFSLTKQVEWKTYTLCGTPEYMAPEIIQHVGHGVGVDWWALGVLLYELLVGQTPFAAPTPLAVFRNVMRGSVALPKSLSEAAVSLLRRLLTADTARRFGCLKDGYADILRHRVSDIVCMCVCLQAQMGSQVATLHASQFSDISICMQFIKRAVNADDILNMRARAPANLRVSSVMRTSRGAKTIADSPSKPPDVADTTAAPESCAWVA